MIKMEYQPARRVAEAPRINLDSLMVAHSRTPKESDTDFVSFRELSDNELFNVSVVFVDDSTISYERLTRNELKARLVDLGNRALGIKYISTRFSTERGHR